MTKFGRYEFQLVEARRRNRSNEAEATDDDDDNRDDDDMNGVVLMSWIGRELSKVA